MERIFGHSLLPMLGAIALMGACALEEPPASSELAAEASIEPDVASDLTSTLTSGLASDVAASTMQPARSCNSDKDCKDGDGDTIDWCDPSDECEHRDRWDCEDEHSDCDKHKDCLDGDSDTKDWCYRGKCHHADRDTGRCEKPDDHDDECDRDKDCKDGDGDTIDWCDPSDECEHRDRWDCEDEHSDCDKHKDCLDGDSDTKDWCYRGKCHHADRDTGRCED